MFEFGGILYEWLACRALLLVWLHIYIPDFSGLLHAAVATGADHRWDKHDIDFIIIRLVYSCWSDSCVFFHLFREALRVMWD